MRGTDTYKSNNDENATMLYSGARPGSPSPHREVDDLTTDATTSKLPLRDSSQRATSSSQFYTGLEFPKVEVPYCQRTSRGKFSYGDTYSPLRSDPLDQERARVKKALDDRRDNSLRMMVFSEAEGSAVLLAGDLLLEALTPIRDRIRGVASSEPKATRLSPTGSAGKIAEDAILTAQKLWRLVHLIHENTHGDISAADRDIAVARFTDLVLESAPVTVKAWTGLTDVDRKIDRILDERETRDGAIAREEVLRKASRKFALLTSSQRQALREAWSPETKYKENNQKGWKQEPHSMSASQPAEHPMVFEFSADARSNATVQHSLSARRLGAEVPRIRNDEQKNQQNELSSRLARFSADPEQLDSRFSYADWSRKASSQSNFYDQRSMESESFSGEVFTLEPSHLGSWADESADVPPARPQPAKDPEFEVKFCAAITRDSNDDIDYATHVGEDEDRRRQSMSPITRPRSPDIVDDLLAEWTTLPR